MSDEQAKIKLDWVQMTAGALTAVTSAVLLSTVGVAGTLIGVAVGSVVGTVGNAVYSHYLKLSRQRVAKAKVLKVAAQRTRDPQVEADVDAELAAGGDEEQRVAWREVVAGLPWRRLAKVTAGVFVVALGAILAFELVSGRALSTFTGGTDRPVRTSIPGIDRDRAASDDSDDSDRRQQDPTGGTQEPSPTSEPTASPTGTPETPSTTPEPTPTPAEPTETAPPATDPTVAPPPE